jgi:hypothetical protein
MHGSEKTVIACPESLDISMVTDFSVELNTALDTKHDVQFMAADVERADAAALQLLSAFCLDAQAEGLNVEWLEPSEALVGAAQQIDLARHLGLGDGTIP